MGTRRPLVNTSGDPAEIPTGDTIDPAYLPPGSATSDTFAFFVAS